MRLLAEAARGRPAPHGPLPLALVWWQGEAAETYQRRVQERVAALAATSARLEAAGRGVPSCSRR